MVRNITGAILCCLLFFITQVNAQNSVGIGTPTPNPKAVLELVSPGSNQGLLVPKLTTLQRTATSFTTTLTTKENGLLVFDSDDQKFYYWQTNQWLPIRSGSDSALTAGTGITITGNTISATPDGDGSATNELQELQLTGNALKITGSPTAATVDLSTLVLANETQNLQLTGNTLKITGNPNATAVNLSPYVQDLDFTGGVLKITNNPTATSINLTSVTNTDDQILTYNNSNGQLSISTLSTPQSVTITPVGTAGGDLTGTYPNPTIGTGKVTSAGILDGTIATADLANSSVTDAKIATGITVSKVTAGTNGQFLSTVTGVPTWTTLASLPPNGTAGGDLTGSYPNPTIGTGKVTTGAILDGTILNADIANVDASKITTGTLPLTIGGTGATTAAGARTNLGLGSLATLSAVTTTEITDGTIVNADITSVDASKITTGTLPVTRGGSGITTVTPGAVAYGGATNFAFTTAGTTGQLLQSNGTGAPTWTTLTALPPNGTAGGDLSGSYPNPTIGTGKVTTGAILDGTILNADIANVDASKITTGTLPLTVGGTGATTAAGARTNLGLGSLATLSTVTTTEITDGTIATVDVANGAVTDAKIASGITPSKITASATNSQVLTTVAGVTSWANLPASGTGSVTNIATGTGLTGGPITTTGTISLGNTGVGAATYGSATQVPILTVDLQGRITSASTATVTAAAANLSSVLTAGNDAGGAKITNLGTPTLIADATTKQYVDGLDAADPDKSVTNEIQDLSLTANTLSLSSDATTVNLTPYLDNTDAQNLSATPSGTNRTINISGGTGVTISVADNDNSITNEIQDLKSVVNQGTDADDKTIVNVGGLGIGTSSPKATLSVVGSHSVSFIEKTGSYPIQKGDYLVISDGAGAVVTLPPAAEVPGRVLIIRTLDNDKGLDVRPTSGDKIDGVTLVKIADINGQVNVITVVADGKNGWWIINKSVK